MEQPTKRIALLIDADNAPAAKIDLILVEVARFGVANVRRAYGNWKDPNLKGWESRLHEFAIHPIQQFPYSKGKNASDMAMVIDGMDLLYARNLDGVAIVSSDADFTPLAMRLKSEGLEILGFGEKKTPEPFRNACSRFTLLEGLLQPDVESPLTQTRAETSLDPQERRRLVQMLRSAVEASVGEDGWAHLGQVGNQVSNQASFDPRNYGYRNLSNLVEDFPEFEVKRQNLTVWIQNRQTPQK